MATSSRTSSALRSPRDPIRVVPIRVDGRLVAPEPSPAPSLTYRVGPLLTAAQILTFFWGDGWQAQPQAEVVPQIIQFFDYVVTSPLIDQLAEYGAAGNSIGHGTNL